MSELNTKLNKMADDLAEAIREELAPIPDEYDVEQLISRAFDDADWDDIVSNVDVSGLIDWDYHLEDYAKADGPGSPDSRIKILVDRVEKLEMWHARLSTADMAELAQVVVNQGTLAKQVVQEMDGRSSSVHHRLESVEGLADQVGYLRAQLALVGAHLFVLAANLRGDTTATWEATAATLGEAADQVPDNRVDGNGVRIADLEAVEDELAGN